MQRQQRLKRLIHPGPWLATAALAVLCAAPMSACGERDVVEAGDVQVEAAPPVFAMGAGKGAKPNEDIRGPTKEGMLLQIRPPTTAGVPEGLLINSTMAIFPVKPGCEKHSDDVNLPALKPLLDKHQARIAAQASAVGCLVRPGGDTFAGTAWVLDSEQRHIVTARHVITGTENPFGTGRLTWRSVLGWKFQVPCALQADETVEKHILQDVVFDGGAEDADLDLVVLKLRDGSPLPQGLPISKTPPPITPDAPEGRRWVLVPGYLSVVAKDELLSPLAATDDPLRCIPDEAYESLAPGVGYVGAPGEEAWASWPFFLHTADTSWGASGAPVIDLISGLVIGVHSNYAATLLSANVGQHAELLQSLDTTDRNLAFTAGALCALQPDRCQPNP